MTPHSETPAFCRDCNTKPCDGDYLKCMQDARERNDDMKYDEMRDMQDEMCSGECPR